jgi:hypothetical protein
MGIAGGFGEVNNNVNGEEYGVVKEVVYPARARAGRS